MNVKVADNSKNLIISNKENIKDKSHAPIPKENDVEKLLKPNYNSKTDFSKLLKDPKIADKKVQFATLPDNTKTTEDCSDLSKICTNILDQTVKTVKNENTLSVASSVLSAVKIPQVEPIKLTINILTSDNKIKGLANDIENENYIGVVNNTVDFAKSGYGSAVGIAKITEWGTDIIANIGILSKTGKAVTRVSTITGAVTSVANKIALPFSIIGTGMSAIDIKVANDKVNAKKKQIKYLDTVIATKPNSKAKEVQQKFTGELRTLKTNRELKSLAFGLSAVSSATLVASIKNPVKAKTYATISLATSIASSLTSVVADDKIRNKLSGLAQNIRSRFDR